MAFGFKAGDAPLPLMWSLCMLRLPHLILHTLLLLHSVSSTASSNLGPVNKKLCQVGTLLMVVWGWQFKVRYFQHTFWNALAAKYSPDLTKRARFDRNLFITSKCVRYECYGLLHGIFVNYGSSLPPWLFWKHDNTSTHVNYTSRSCFLFS